MKSYCTDGFWKRFNQLPSYIQKQAHSAYEHFKRDSRYPSLHFKCVNKQRLIYSARVGIDYRVLGRIKDDEIIWFWIGPHSEYDRLISEL